MLDATKDTTTDSKLSVQNCFFKLCSVKLANAFFRSHGKSSKSFEKERCNSLSLLISHLLAILAGLLRLTYILSQIMFFFSSKSINRKFVKDFLLLIQNFDCAALFSIIYFQVLLTHKQLN